MKHTPGPWKIWDEGKTYPFEIYPATGGAVLAALPKSENAEANAKLIAAAPELLELLKQFVSDIETRDPIYPSWIEAARAVIAKTD